MTWTIDEDDVPNNTSETAAYDSLSLSFTVPKNIRDTIRYLSDNAGEVEVDPEFAGAFRATDMSSNIENTFELSPPDDRSDVSYEGTVLVDGYTEDRVGPRGEQYSLDIDFVKRRPRDPGDNLVDQTRGTGEWKFDFSDGAISTKTGIDADSITENVSGTASFGITLNLSYEQTRVIRECPTRLAGDGIEEVEVQDGEDTVADNVFPRNTVEILSPQGGEDILASGEYVVVDWSAEWKGGFYQVTLELGQ